MSATSITAASAAPRRWPDYRTVWRWHFYAGVLCIPFVLWLAGTGSIYLFKPQIDAWLDAPYDNLQLTGPAQSPLAEVRAALAAVPGGVLNAYELPATPRSAARVLVGHGAELFRVYIHPQTLQVLHVVREDERFTRMIFYLHGELMQGDRGSRAIETAASWTLVMLITGLYLWWPRAGAGAAGVLYPRLRRGQRVFWRDLHAVAGIWIAFFAIFLLVSGLPWAKSWGGMLRSVRQVASSTVVQQDWTTGRSSELAERQRANAPAADEGEHAGHAMAARDVTAIAERPAAASSSHGVEDEHARMSSPMHDPSPDYRALDRIVPTVAALDLPAPVLISPPSRANADWNARSDTQNRPHRVTLVLDGASGRILSWQSFSQRPLLDRIIGIGVAAHEGQLFAPLNQALGVFTALGLITLCVSAIVLWWRRRPEGVLGAPAPVARPRLAVAVFALIALLGVVLPLFGATLLLMLALEKLVLRHHPGIQRFLGLRGAVQP